MPEWTWNDGWILMSVFLAQGEDGAELHQIIGVADAINHAIPTSQELSESFARFANCGLMVNEGDRYAIASEFLSAIKKAYDGKGGLFSSADKGLKWLKKSGLVENAKQCVDVDDRQVESAYNRYVKALRKR